MSTVLTGFAIFLLLNLAAGMLRAFRGPTSSDRMSAALLFGSTVVALLLVLAERDALPALRDVALLFVLLAAILTVAFVGLPAGDAGDEDAESPGEEGGAPPAGTPG
jgi:multicomponent Na+:H+ antiporter subunit F